MPTQANSNESPQPSLHTERLVLRPFRYSDALRVQLLAGDARVAATGLNIPHPYPDGVAEAWIATHLSDFLAGKRVTYAITLPEVGVIGDATLRVTARHRTGELGYWVGFDYWGRGYATEAARAVMEFGAERFALEKIKARHMIENPASGRVLEKLGLVKEGVLLGDVVKGDRRLDIVMYGLLL